MLTGDRFEMVRFWLFAASTLVAAAVVIGAYLDYELFPTRIRHLSWRLIVGGSAVGLLLAVSIWLVDSKISRDQKAEISSIRTDLSLAEVHAQDRQVNLGDVIDERTGIGLNNTLSFLDLDHKGQKLHIFVIKDDAEALKFAISLGRMLGPERLGWQVSIEQFDFRQITSGEMPGGMWGLLENNKAELVKSASSALYGALSQANFCIIPAFVQTMFDLSDKSPDTVSLFIGKKDRISRDGCR